jgi:hypothetical protein
LRADALVGAAQLAHSPTIAKCVKRAVKPKRPLI